MRKQLLFFNVALLTLITGCGSNPSNREPTSGADPGKGFTDTSNPCPMLTSDMVQSQLGLDITFKPQTSTTGKDCTFYSTDGLNAVMVQWGLTTAEYDAVTQAEISAGYAMTVSGVGDGAIFMSKGDGLYVKAGTGALSIMAIFSHHEPVPEDKLISFAKYILAPFGA
jgi:hypothetical protein